MTLQEIQRLVRRGEGVQIEFKRKVAHPNKIIREIVAFANTRGGSLLIGVDDNGNIPGVRSAEEERYGLEKAIRQWCRPSIDYEVEVVPISGQKSVIHYKILEGQRKPHYVLRSAFPEADNAASLVKKPKGKGRAYVRHDDKSLQASPEVWQILRRSRKDKDVKFQFGDKERVLMTYLEENTQITVNQFAKLVKESRYRASRTLILLVLANVLRVIPQEKEDTFVLKYRQT
ncbi:MAG: ATP-binding protein [Tunicatimonas sp.]